MNTERVKINLMKVEADDQGNYSYIGTYGLKVLPPNGWKCEREFNYRSLDKMFSEIENYFGNNPIISLESKELPEEIRNENWFDEREIISQRELEAIVKVYRRGGHILELA